jgi:uncharacterized membrane protein YgcG
MKQKTIVIIFVLIMLIGLLVPNKVSAISSSGGYTIESYNINMIVNEDNTFDITETISVNFTGDNKHGIYRKLPLKNSIKRTDGTKSINRAKISNISVSDTYTISNESRYKVIKIGDANKTVSGQKIYTIKYTYNIGKDPLKNADELYFNLIGDEWDTSISNVTFTIVMPKSFDKTNLGFSSGSKSSINSSDVIYTVTGNTIKGALNTTLYSEQALTVRLTLPEGYFVGTSGNYDYFMILNIIISIVFVLIAYVIWKKYGKDDIVVDTVEFYPPDGLNSADVGFIYKGHSKRKDIISLLIFLANKGYLRIEEYQEKILKVIKINNFRIVKLKEYDGNNEDERIFFNDLFIDKNEVTKSDLHNAFHFTLDKIARNIESKENKEKVFEKDSFKKRKVIVGMIIIVFLLIIIHMFIHMIEVEFGIILIVMLTMIFLVPALEIVYIEPNAKNTISSSFIFVIISVCCMTFSVDGVDLIDLLFIIQCVIQTLCIIVLNIFLGIMKKRTEYGNEMLGRIQGFKNFLDPEYFYNILPYTYVLGVSKKWMKKFENITLEAPAWYYGDIDFSTHSFNRFMNSTYTSIGKEMSSATSNSGSGLSGGGFSGGGSSGRGSGGGGGGSW